MNRFALTVLIFAMVTGAPALAATAPAPAPTTSPTASPLLQRIGTVKVTGASSSREEQFQAPFSGSVIDRQQLQELGPKSMQGILSSSPSVQAFAFGGSPYVRTHLSFRGFTGGEFGETLDGIPLNGLFNGGVTNSASQRNATPFVTDLIGAVNIYRGVNDPQHTSIDSLGGSVAYHLIDPTPTSSTSLTYNAGHGVDAFIQTGVTPLGGAKFAIAFGSDYYRGFQNDVPDANRYVYLNGTVPLSSRDFVRLIYSYDHNVGYVPHDVPLQSLSGVPGFSIAESGISFQWPATLTYSHNTADVNLLLADYAHQWTPALVSRLTLFRYDTQYQRMAYTNANYPFLPNSPFAPTFAQGFMNGTISSNAQDFAYHLYQMVTKDSAWFSAPSGT